MNSKILSLINLRFLDDLLGKSLYIRMSRPDDYILSEDQDGKLKFAQEDPGLSNYTFLSKDGDSYTFKHSGLSLCVENKELKKCDYPSFFDIQKTKWGFKIIRRGLCLTIDTFDKLTMKDCDETSMHQHFIFEVQSSKFCENIDDPKSSPPGTAERKLKKKMEDKMIQQALAKHGIKDNKTAKALSKAWKKRNWPKWRWPKFGGFC